MTNKNERRIFVDLEHTGGKGRHILELAVVSEDGEILFNSKIKPPSQVFSSAEDMSQWKIAAAYSHGISAEDVASAPLLEDVLAGLLPIFDGAVMVAHNSSCELSVLPKSLVSKLAGSACTHRTFKKSFPDATSTKLGSALAYAGIELKNAHEALADAVGCLRLAKWMETRGVFMDASVGSSPSVALNRKPFMSPEDRAKKFKGPSPVGFAEISEGLRSELAGLNALQRSAGVNFFRAGQSWDSKQELELKTMVEQGDCLLDISKAAGRSPLSVALVIARLFDVAQARRLVMSQLEAA